MEHPLTKVNTILNFTLMRLRKKLAIILYMVFTV